MKRFILLVQFLTRLPIPLAVPAEDEDFNRSLVYFPVVGLLIGAILSVVTYLSLKWLDPLSTAVLIVLAEAIITGGLHLDGLADSFDGLYSYRSKERILEIMKDSRIGSNGVLALIGIFLLKITFMMNVFNTNELWQSCLLVILMPMMTRAMIVYGSKRSIYAREQGMGNYFIGRVTHRQFVIVFCFVGLLSLLVPQLIFVLIGLMMFSEFYVRHCKKIIGGMTGDTLGALCELSGVMYWILVLFIKKVGGA